MVPCIKKIGNALYNEHNIFSVSDYTDDKFVHKFAFSIGIVYFLMDEFVSVKNIQIFFMHELNNLIR